MIQWVSSPLTRALEHECDGVSTIIRLDGDDIVISSTLEHLCHAGEVHPHGDVAVAPKMFKTLGPQKQCHQGHMAGVHGLQRESGRGAVEVGICYQIFDGLQHLLEQTSLDKPELQHFALSLSLSLQNFLSKNKV